MRAGRHKHMVQMRKLRDLERDSITILELKGPSGSSSLLILHVEK